MSANKLHFEATMDGTGFARGMESIGHSVTHNLKGLVAGAFGVYSIHQALHKTVESAEELVTASKRLDTTVEQLQVLRQAAKENSVEFGKLESAFEKLNIAREKALGGDAKAMAAFTRLGVSRDDLQNKSASDIFTGSLRNTVLSGSSQDLAAPLKDIFGRAFGQLIPLMKTDFEELEGKLKSVGAIMSTDMAVKVKMLAEEFGLLANVVAAGLAPVLIQFVQVMVAIVSELKSMGTFWGDFTQRLSKMDISENKEWRDGVKSLWKQAGRAFTTAGSVAETDQEEFAEYIVEMEAKAAKMTNDLLHPKPPGGGSLQDALESSQKQKRGQQPYSDELLAVGNFLGSGRAVIGSIYEQQLQVAQRTLDETISQTAILKKISDNSASMESNWGGEVP